MPMETVTQRGICTIGSKAFFHRGTLYFLNNFFCLFLVSFTANSVICSGVKTPAFCSCNGMKEPLELILAAFLDFLLVTAASRSLIMGVIGCTNFLSSCCFKILLRCHILNGSVTRVLRVIVVKGTSTIHGICEASCTVKNVSATL